MITIVSIALVAALSTFHLSQLKAFSTIRASSLLTLIAYVIFYFISSDYEVMAIIFFGGTFVGMSCPSKMHNFTLVLGSFLFALLFKHLVPLLEGHGGALGLSAFLSIVIIQLILHFYQKLASCR